MQNGNVPEHIWVTRDVDDLPEEALIGELKLTQGVFTDSCTFPHTYKMLRKEARLRGANLVQVTGIRYPSTLNGCQGIKARAYRLENPVDYLHSIHWSPNVLEWDHFRESERPDEAEGMAAASFCEIRLEFRNVPLREPYIRVIPVFLPQRSWVAGDRRRPELLRHEQGHFDLCEIQARRLRRSLDSLVSESSRAEIGQARKLFEYHLEQYKRHGQEYDRDTDHGVILEEQYKWDRRIEQQLDSLEEFAVRI